MMVPFTQLLQLFRRQRERVPLSKLLCNEAKICELIVLGLNAWLIVFLNPIYSRKWPNFDGILRLPTVSWNSWRASTFSSPTSLASIWPPPSFASSSPSKSPVLSALSPSSFLSISQAFSYGPSLPFSAFSSWTALFPPFSNKIRAATLSLRVVRF